MKLLAQGLCTILVLVRLASAQAPNFSQPDSADQANSSVAAAPSSPLQPPVPLLAKGQPVAWWFVFKFNSASFPECGSVAQRACRFGGSVQNYKAFGQQYVVATAEQNGLQKGDGCLGDTETDPVGATFGEVYNGSFYYVVWNDQFYNSPGIKGCSKSCSGPWGHSKGVIAWDDSGAGFVMQVTTPSWPASGSTLNPRQSDGNTLGCVIDDDVEVSQHFFALRLSKSDLREVLRALQNASVVTDPQNPQLVRNGGPADVQQLVAGLGVKSDSKTVLDSKLSSGVELISKPSKLNVPPWQLVSAMLGGINLRAATWWASPKIYSTTASTDISCWDQQLAAPGPVEIATGGHWGEKQFGLTGGSGPDFNHAKIGVSTGPGKNLAIFGDMNQQGAISGNCASSQNGRGGLFYVIDSAELHDSVKELIAGGTAGTSAH
jgi:hypothetical protein